MTKDKAIAIAIIFFLITVFPIGYGNYMAQKGGILDNSLLNESDPYLLADQKVANLSAEGLKTGDAVTLVIPFPLGITPDDMKYILHLTWRLKDSFPKYGIMSLATIANYKDTGSALLTDPYITTQVINDLHSGQLNMQDWKAQVQKNSSVYGLLVGNNFNYAQVAMTLPMGYDEIATFREVVEFLEQREIFAVEWFFKTDIHPAPEFSRVKPAGWVMARGLMDAALIADVLKLSTVGLIFVWILAYFHLSSERQASIVVIVITICFAWARGSIGLLQVSGFEIYERVYSLFVYTAIIVAGISLSLRKFDAYNRGIKNGASSDESWKNTTKIHHVMLATAVVAIANFGTAYQIQVRGIWEMGILSALGVAFLVILTFYFLPALHVLFGGESKVREISAFTWWDSMLDNVASACYKLIDYFPNNAKFNVKHSARRAALIITATLMTAFMLVVLDYVPMLKPEFLQGFKFIEVKTRPLEYIDGTIIYEASETLNQTNGYGFDRLSVLVGAKNKNFGDYSPIESPEFLAQVSDLEKRIGEKIAGVRKVTSVIGSIKTLSGESYGTELPQNPQIAHDILTQIEADLGPLLKEQLWYKDGIVIFVSMSSDDSNQFSRVRDEIIALSKEFKGIEVTTFGKISTYPETDKYIREGKPINVLTSQWVVIVLFAVWVIVGNFKDKYRADLYGWRTGIVLNIPFLFATGVIAIVMAALRVPLDQATAIIAALAINAAVDFGWYLAHDYAVAIKEGKSEREAFIFAVAERGGIIVMDIVANIICFAPLLLSNFIPISRLGWVMMIMLLACGVGALVLMPPFLPWCVKKK